MGVYVYEIVLPELIQRYRLKITAEINTLSTEKEMCPCVV